MKGRISKRTIDDLKPGQLITDVDTPGFVARRLPSGVVTYGFRYRAANGRRSVASPGRDQAGSPRIKRAASPKSTPTKWTISVTLAPNRSG